MVRIKKSGFSLIELMIAVAIIAILTAIAYPTYQRHVQKTKRAEVQAEMLDIGKMMFRYKVTNGSFAGATVQQVYGSEQSPMQGNAVYKLAFDPSPTTATGWTLVATPIEATTQEGNGSIRLNDLGQRCWEKAQAACVLSATSTWDGQ